MRRRLSVMVLSVTLVALVAFGVPLGLAVKRLYRNEANLRLERAAASSAIQVPVTFQGSRDPVELAQPGDGNRLALYGTNQRRLTGSGPDRADPIVVRAVHGHAANGRAGGDLVAAVPLTSNERVYAVVRAAVPWATVEDRAQRAWATMAGTAMAALLLAALVSWRQTRRMVRPVSELADAADRLGAGDFSVRPGVTGIAELDTVAQALSNTAERLGTMVGRERTFSEDASHQLRSPLTGLRLRLETARATPSMTTSELVEGALGDVERLDATVDALLTLAREVHPARTTVDIAALLRAVDATWHGRLAADGRRLRVAAPHQRTDILASAAALRQVLDVLVSNAAEHGAGTVSVEAHDIRGGLAIDVADEGAGVAEPTGAIFTRRPDSSGSHGIGLALARSLTEAEGGRLVLRHAGPRPVFRILLAGGPAPPGVESSP